MKNIKKIISVVMACLILAGVFATGSFAAGYIGMDKAKEIALNHAGITADKASFMKCEFDYDDGIAVYDVEFYFDRCEYNYEINARNGKILKVEKDTFGVNVPNPDQEFITMAEAKAIAFEHAGVKEADAKKVRVEFDFDDGVAEYSVEFHADKFDYDYEIDAVSGKILKVEKDRDFDFSDVFFVRWFDAIASFIKNLFK